MTRIHVQYAILLKYSTIIIILTKRPVMSRGVARKCVMLKPNTFFQLKLLVFHNFFSERPGEIPYLKKSR